MDRDEIMAMVPGRELDALVAEKVMDLDVIEYGEDWYCPECKSWVNSKQINYMEQHDICGYYAVSDWPCDSDGNVHPCYSTDISAAWEVVNKFNGYCYIFQYKDWIDGKWECKLTHNGEREYYGIGETAPEAICKAGLLAIGRKEISA